MQVAVIGLGQAGSNVADEADKLGFLTGSINFSQKDLNAVNVQHKLRLLGSEGVGKNRDEAIRLFRSQWETAQSFIVDNFSNSDLIIFSFSSSGGSGSGIAPILLDVMSNTMTDKTFIAFAILPELSEATTGQINCLNTFSELSRQSVAIFPIDNEQIRKMNPNIGKNKLFEISNKESIGLLQKIISYTEKYSKNGNFDKKDLLTVLDTQGMATIAEVDITTLGHSINLTFDGVAQKVVESWQNTVFTPLEFDKITRSAIIFDGQEILMEHVRHEIMFKDFANPPLDIFEGNYHEKNGKILSLLTGLTWFSKRLNDIERLIKTNKNKVESALEEQAVYHTDSSDLLLKIRKNPEKKNVMDILSKYIK